MKKIKKDQNKFPNFEWYPMFTEYELHELLEKVWATNPGHPLLVEPILIGKN